MALGDGGVPGPVRRGHEPQLDAFSRRVAGSHPRLLIVEYIDGDWLHACETDLGVFASWQAAVRFGKTPTPDAAVVVRPNPRPPVPYPCNTASLNRWLIVDDEPDMRFLLRVLVTTAGAQVVAEASNGQEAIRHATDTNPSGVLLDLMMPVMSGQEALPALRQMLPSSTLVVCTARYLDTQDLVALSAAGANHVLMKGTNLAHELTRIIAARAKGVD